MARAGRALLPLYPEVDGDLALPAGPADHTHRVEHLAHGRQVLGRVGQLQLDDRVVSVNDQTLVGATILRRFGNVELSLEHSHDVKSVPGKTETQYTNLRMVVAL